MIGKSLNYPHLLLKDICIYDTYIYIQNQNINNISRITKKKAFLRNCLLKKKRNWWMNKESLVWVLLELFLILHFRIRTVHPGIGKEQTIGTRGRTVPARGSGRMGRCSSAPAILKEPAQFAHRFKDFSVGWRRRFWCWAVRGSRIDSHQHRFSQRWVPSASNK